MTFSFAPISLGHTKPQDELDEALVGGQKKLDQDKDGDIDAKDFAMLRGKKKKKKNEDEPEGENGDTATMSPKMGDVKEYGMVYSNKNKKGRITPPYPASEGVNEVSFRPDDETSLGKRYADKVMRGDYSSKKTDNRKKGIATMVYKRAAQKGVPGVAKVPFTENNPAHYDAIAKANARRNKERGVPDTPNLNDPKFKMTKKDKMTKDPMNPTGAMTGYRSKIKDHVEKDGNMSIREKLISVVERANHGNMDSKETYDDMYKGAGAKKMRKDHQNMKVDTTRKLGVDDASKAGKAIKKAPMRNADNPKGDINIVPPGTPMKDPAASKDTALENVMAAYKSMNEVSQELAFKAADKAETNRKKSKGPFGASDNYRKRARQSTKFTQAGMYRQYKDGKLTTGEGGLKIGKRKAEMNNAKK